MRITYDYSEFLQEFREELYECALSLEDEVLVLRGKPLPDGYRPVIDWYYDEDVMLDMLADAEITNEAREEFNRVYDFLEPIKVKDLIVEMKRKSTLFGDD
jgi:hypothetical protein